MSSNLLRIDLSLLDIIVYFVDDRWFQ